MKTIIHVETTDEERVAIGKGKPVTRKDITDMVNKFIQERINGHDEEVQPVQRSDDQRSPLPRAGLPKQSNAEFIPSRGDEPYLSQPTDPGIAAACSRILDDTALIQAYAWDTVERNRKK